MTAGVVGGRPWRWRCTREGGAGEVYGWGPAGREGGAAGAQGMGAAGGEVGQRSGGGGGEGCCLVGSHGWSETEEGDGEEPTYLSGLESGTHPSIQSPSRPTL